MNFKLNFKSHSSSKFKNLNRTVTVARRLGETVVTWCDHVYIASPVKVRVEVKLHDRGESSNQLESLPIGPPTRRLPTAAIRLAGWITFQSAQVECHIMTVPGRQGAHQQSEPGRVTPAQRGTPAIPLQSRLHLKERSHESIPPPLARAIPHCRLVQASEGPPKAPLLPAWQPAGRRTPRRAAAAQAGLSSRPWDVQGGRCSRARGRLREGRMARGAEREVPRQGGPQRQQRREAQQGGPLPRRWKPPPPPRGARRRGPAHARS